MMNYSTIDVSVDRRGVARLELNRPEKRNALSDLMIGELFDAARYLGEDTTIRAVILAASGSVFCAGGDLGWMMAQIKADRQTRLSAARKLAHMLRALNELPKPLIGRIQGSAYGGGVGLISVCDIAIAADTAQFALTETRIGLIPATIAPYVIARLGAGHARHAFISAEGFDAVEARRLNLVAKIVPAGQLDEALSQTLAPYLEVAPGAAAAAKSMIRSLGPRIDDTVLEATIGRLADIWESDEAHIGISAFLEKRPPPWRQNKQGREK